MRLHSPRLRVAVAAALLATFLLTAPAAAVEKGWTTYYDAGGRPWLSIGLWGGYAHFNSRYQVVKMQDAGQTWWSFTRFETSAVVPGGRNCDNSGYCIGWAFGSKVQFLNASGAVLNTVYPPPGSCYADIIGGADKLIEKCSQYGYQISASATRIKYTFNLTVYRRDGWAFSWATVYKTVPIV